MIWNILYMLLGLGLLVKGADWLVDGASSLARKYRISELAIGLTIVAFGTSAPELVVNIISSSQQHYDIVLGNIIGSNNFNLFMILGVAGLISPLVVKSGTVWKEIPLSLMAALLLLFMANDTLHRQLPVISRLDGMIFLMLFALFLWYVYRQMKTDLPDHATVEKQRPVWLIAIFIASGLAGLVIGGKLVVDNAVKFATELGVSEKVIGLTIIAAGTSLPELFTSVVAVMKKNNDIAIGNVIGSNIFNIFLILGISSLVKPIPYNTHFNTDLWILTGGTIFLFIAMFTGQRKKLDRWEAAVLLVTFIAYTTFLVMQE
ncbi:calcium/sodium antiporter [Saccharicrinis sp. FJH54]|uniref:calcium/sodium antiporter n=1 Tax=Saccharicrinis sp. FJH54 TaxID=3344665 RepID=UPI0035D4830C